MIRLDKYLADTGLGTRHETRACIRRGVVTVDGQVQTDPGFHIEETRHVVCVEGRPVRYQAFLYYMMNKPAGFLSATQDTRQKTVLDLLPDNVRSRGLFPVGRLDKDTMGLLLLTNDGALAHRLLSPRYKVQKTYLAQVDRRPSSSEIERFENGTLVLDGRAVLPAKLRVVREEPPVLVEATVREGRYHQIKRMLSACGCETQVLRRLSMGALILDSGLPEGCCRSLTPEEQQDLVDCVKKKREE